MGFQNLKLIIRKNKILYYTHSFLRQAIPGRFYKSALKSKLAAINNYDITELADRVNYYNKLGKPVSIGEGAIELQNIQIFKHPKAYNFDTYEYSRYFNERLKVNLLFGDITYSANLPSIQKSRPIDGDNANAILLKLDKKRHFLFIKDRKPFADKKDLLIGRGIIRQPHRIRFMDMYFNNPLCDLGEVNKKTDRPQWLKSKISIVAHLDYKFILSLEGNDVATNLKWIMSSNSIAVMPKPKYETWFMEGRLIGDHHYIQINDDYTDLEEKLNYYINNPQQAQQIVDNANAYVKQFINKRKEDLVSLLVLEKYFYSTGQIDRISI
ncbi:Glycosyl transferase family 90 [Mucilaginibacter mallensis]|uniref:Glycosyl transferase family 90 n=1 Tax=Mucilaginibacter mallensis TaxID=652787 RepID=A0A1H2C430_MUCMA|nr:glycosyl transferase family 90 [Mucilaginibacter mallensis]SDT65082.1 Glycosyl transferase family 90 [Mucilaginibacter mallensis]